MPFNINKFKYNLKKAVWKRNPIVRILQTKNYTTKKLVIGQINGDGFAKDWVTVDYSHSDFNVDLNSNYKFSFANDSMELLYTAHCLEHLFEEKAQYLLKESFRILKSGGKMRIEVPDVEKVVDHYQKQSSEYLNEFNKRYGYMCNVLGYDKKYLASHIGLLGTISNYFDDGVDYQIPVYVAKEQCDQYLSSNSLDSFCEWCVNLQTKEQLKSPGHKTYLYFDKLKKMLKSEGFKNIKEVDFGESSFDEFSLNGENNSTISEKPHRRFYSLYIEAEKE